MWYVGISDIPLSMELFSLPMMGMQSYDKRSAVSIRKSDVGIAKNYLNEGEIKLLGLLVEQYLAFAETMAQQHTPMYMKDCVCVREYSRLQDPNNV